MAHILAAKGPLVSGQISQFTKLPAKQVRESLFVLVHHGLVMWSQTVSPVLGAPDVVTYHLQLDQVILRLAYPIFIRLAHSQLGQQVHLIRTYKCISLRVGCGNSYGSCQIGKVPFGPTRKGHLGEALE